MSTPKTTKKASKPVSTVASVAPQSVSAAQASPLSTSISANTNANGLRIAGVHTTEQGFFAKLEQPQVGKARDVFGIAQVRQYAPRVFYYKLSDNVISAGTEEAQELVDKLQSALDAHPKARIKATFSLYLSDVITDNESAKLQRLQGNEAEYKSFEKLLQDKYIVNKYDDDKNLVPADYQGYSYFAKREIVTDGEEDTDLRPSQLSALLAQ